MSKMSFDEDRKTVASGDSNGKVLDRRDFLKKASTVGFLGLLGTELHSKQDKSNRIMSYRTLGNTSLKASDISFGAGGLSNYRVAHKAISLGINYFDTAPDYGAGSSEEELGKAITRSSLSRDKLILTSKFCYTRGYPGHMYNGKKGDYIRAVEGSLRRLNTDYIDFMLIHALGERDSNGKEIYRLEDSELLEAYDSLKRAGKLRYLGVSSHNYKAALDGGMDYAIDSGNFKLIMLAYNFKGRSAGKSLLNKIISLSNKAKRKGVAFVAMKTLRGAGGLNPLLDEGRADYAQSSFKWVLSNKSVSCLVVTMRGVSQINDYVKASGQKLSSYDTRLLEKYAANDNDCELGCSDCEASCPVGLKVSSILRYNMYFANYHQEKYAMKKYSLLDSDVSVCKTCTSLACEQACPFSLAVRNKLYSAHANLSLG